MRAWLRSRMPSTDPVEGFWGKPTATIDWCEKNYEVNYYVAEWWNTITNLFIILPAIWGFREVYQNGYKKRIYVLYFLMFMVGVGSWLFHMTLLFSYQLLDELPMVFFCLFHVYYLTEVPNAFSSKNLFSNKPLFLFLFGFSIFFTLLYLLWPQPLFQEVVFAGFMLYSFFLEGRIVYWKRCKTCKRLFIAGVAVMWIAFFLWNVDVIFCSTLEDVRSAAPGLGPFTQLHGWWHALSGYSGALHVLFAIHAWYDFHKEEEDKHKLEVVHAGLSLRWV